MTGLVEIAAKFAASAAIASHISAPIGFVNYGLIHYDIRAVNRSSGVGGSPPYCGPIDSDVIQIVYSVTNNNSFALPQIAVPRMVIVDPNGNVVQPDRQLSEAVALKATPPILLHNASLGAHQSAVQADVFVTKKFDTRNRQYLMRPLPGSAESQRLPITQPVDTPECPQSTSQ